MLKVSIQNPALTGLTQPPQTQVAKPQGGDDNFGTALMDAIKEVNGMQGQSTQMQNNLMANRPVEYHDLMIAMERASTAMQLTMQVRNKVLEAYQEISRMQI